MDPSVNFFLDPRIFFLEEECYCSIVDNMVFFKGMEEEKMDGALSRSFQGIWDQRPFLVIWEVTRACALACRHCRAEAQPRPHPDELTTREGKKLIDQVAKAGPKIFILTGGDPMKRPDLEELISYASGKGLSVALSPSATPRWLRADLPSLRQAGLKRISMSLDGASESTHDAFRGVRGTWFRTMLGLEAAKDAGLGIQINTTITRQNLREFDEFVALLEDLEPEVWSLFQLVPTGRADTDDLISGEEMEDHFQHLAELSSRVPYGIKTTEGHHYRRVLIQTGKATADTPGMQGIGDGRGCVFVSHTGEICPSGFLPLVAGDVREEQLLDVYRHSKLFRSLRNPDQLKGKCGRCEFRTICGGSRSRSYAMTGDYLAEEPLCVYQPKRSFGRERILS